jgi:hypothetical protein
MSIFDEHLRRDQSKMIIEHDHLSIFGRTERFCGLRRRLMPKVLNSLGLGTPVAALSSFGPCGAVP